MVTKFYMDRSTVFIPQLRLIQPHITTLKRIVQKCMKQQARLMALTEGIRKVFLPRECYEHTMGASYQQPWNRN